MIGTVLAESILITMESNWIQMLCLSVTRDDENASVTIGIDCETTQVSATPLMLFVGRQGSWVDRSRGGLWTCREWYAEVKSVSVLGGTVLRFQFGLDSRRSDFTAHRNWRRC